MYRRRAVSSAEELSPYTRVAAGSNPALPTILVYQVPFMTDRKNTSLFEDFQKLFSELTGLGISFIDTNADFIKLAKGSKPFCEMVSATEKKTGVSNCWISNFKACKKAVSLRKPVIYECHAGLTELIVPVISDGKVIGALITGQIRKKGSVPYRKIRKIPIPPKMGLTHKHLEKEFLNMPETTADKIEAAAHMLDLFANRLSSDDIETLFMKHKPVTSNLQNVVSRATTYIKDNFRDPDISLNRVASQVNLSSFHISHIFRKELKTTFVDFLTRMRLAETARQLKYMPEKSIKEIAYQIGYSDPYYFSKVFKKFYSHSPLSFRRRYMEIH